VAPIAGSNWGHDVRIEGAPAGINTDSSAGYNEVSPGYFGRMGMPPIAGREFTESGNPAAPKVAIVNRQFVKSFLDRSFPRISQASQPRVRTICRLAGGISGGLKAPCERILRIPSASAHHRNGGMPKNRCFPQFSSA
jgi:hypothetical protein